MYGHVVVDTEHRAIALTRRRMEACMHGMQARKKIRKQIEKNPMWPAQRKINDRKQVKLGIGQCIFFLFFQFHSIFILFYYLQ